jgi:hypothetical protein
MNLKVFLERLIQLLVRKYREPIRRTKHARDLERINAAADRLNLEAAEVLEYQASEQ